MVHRELLTKVLPHSNMWSMESYWWNYYPIQICGPWRVTDESVTPFKYVVHGELVTKVLPHSNMWFMESYWRKYYPIQICGSWRVSDESITKSITPFKYVVHGELVTKVLPHSNIWLMESYWRKYYPIQICGSWRVTDESITPFKYVVHGELVMKVLPHMWFMES